MKNRSRWRIALRIVLALGVLFFIAALFTTDRFRSFGAPPGPETLARMRASPRFRVDHFENLEPTGLVKVSGFSTMRSWLLGGEMRAPICPLPVVTDTATRLGKAPDSGLRITWLGHSTTLIEIDGATVLTDPQWSERASPSTIIGPKRFHAPPLALDSLPKLDAVLISHEHFDHLDMRTVQALAARGASFHVPLGIGAHLAKWDVAPNRIFEHDWWERATLPNGVVLVSTPARHFYGRGAPWRVGTLWTSWSLVGPKHRVYFSGDTGLTESFREIAKREGPFDVAMLEIGQSHPSWGDIHLGPAGALEAQAMLGARTLVPIHWATFNLAFHPWNEPPETLVAEADRRNQRIATPRLGEPFEPSVGDAPQTPAERAAGAWWRPYPPLSATCP